MLVRHLLSHTAGLPEFDPPLATADLYDWDKATDRLARQAPRWEPGMLAGYHSITQGFLVGEVVRRVTGDPSPATAQAIRISDGNSVAWRRAEIPSGSGYGNARSVAKVQSVLACGGEGNGIRLLSQAGCERARQEQYRGVDQLLGRSVRYGMGYGLFDPACGWGGWGGSLVMVDLDAHMSVAYVMNQMLQPPGAGDYRGLGIVLAAYDGLG